MLEGIQQEFNGAQEGGKKVFDELTSKGIIGDWREPEVLRFAPVPLYNSFEDVYRFGQIVAGN